MDAAAHRSPVETPGPPPFPERLLAVRTAGAAFDGPWTLRSPAFEKMVDQRAALRAELSATRDILIGALHAAVPGARDAAHRRLLLQLKRDVFNGRAPGARFHEAAPELAPTLDRYAALLHAEAALLDGARAEVVAEQRAALAALLADERFRAACRYSSAGLWEEVEHGPPPPADDFSSLERGLYAYAARFATKANPFHLFAGVTFAPAAGVEADGECEVVLDPALLAAWERDALPHADPARTWLHLRPFRVDGERRRFWVPAERGFRVLSLAEGELLRALADFFAGRRRETGRPTGTRAACAAYLAGRFAEPDGTRASVLLAALVEKGVLGVFLSPDPTRPAEGLRGAGPDGEARADAAARLHLARLDAADLARAEDELRGLAGPGVRTHHVNRYGRGDTRVHEAAAAALHEPLRALKPFFAAEHNFSAADRVVRAFLGEALRSAGGAAPLLELLAPFLRELPELAARAHAESAGERARLGAWRAALAAESGRIGRERLEELRPDPAPAPRALCFNGPFDYVEGVFHPTNAWAGDGRFVARYLLQRGRDGAVRPETPGTVDVELAVPHRSSLTRVVRAFPTGCGFDARLAHEFDRWIDPSEVEIETGDGGEVRYRHAATGARLRFHYRGYLLAEYLPPEYHLLLAGHADTFDNPFLGTDDPAPDGGARHVEALSFGPVCLRRERWVAPSAAVASILDTGCPLRSAAALRDWAHGLGAGTERWYYRTSDRRAKGRKPRYLDLLSPLSVAAFRRAVAPLPADGAVSLSPMQPAAAHLYRHRGAPYVTELMVEG